MSLPKYFSAQLLTIEAIGYYVIRFAVQDKNGNIMSCLLSIAPSAKENSSINRLYLQKFATGESIGFRLDDGSSSYNPNNISIIIDKKSPNQEIKVSIANNTSGISLVLVDELPEIRDVIRKILNMTIDDWSGC